MTVRSLNIGFHIVTDNTLVTIAVPADAGATACLFRGSDANCNALTLINSNTQFQVTLDIGDYVITVDTTYGASSGNPVSVTFGNSVLLWSAQYPAGTTGTRPWDHGVGTYVETQDPKEPWPQVSGGNSSSSTFVSSSSSIDTKMTDLMAANNGRSGVEEADEATAAAS